jgi:hypothetical protein
MADGLSYQGQKTITKIKLSGYVVAGVEQKELSAG